MKNRGYVFLSLVFCALGMLFYGIYNEIIIIRLPFKGQRAVDQSTSKRKNTKLYYWNGTAFVAENKELLHYSSVLRTLQDLTQAWLEVLSDDEEELHKKIVVHAVLMSQDEQTAYISFNIDPIPENLPTFEKLMWIEGLLKTMKESGLPIKFVRFLVQSKPLADKQLHFSHNWPITGYSPHM